jgi:hypothetical protein
MNKFLSLFYFFFEQLNTSVFVNRLVKFFACDIRFQVVIQSTFKKDFKLNGLGKNISKGWISN